MHMQHTPVPVEAISASAAGSPSGPAYPRLSRAAALVPAEPAAASANPLRGAAPGALPHGLLPLCLLLLGLPPAAAAGLPTLLLCALLSPLLLAAAGPSNSPDELRFTATAAAAAEPGLNGVTGAVKLTVSSSGSAAGWLLLFSAAAAAVASAVTAGFTTAGVMGNSHEVSQASSSLRAPLFPLLSVTRDGLLVPVSARLG